MTKKIKKIVQAFPSDKSKTLEGLVVSDKMEKTVVVKVTGIFKHSLYGKVVKRFKKYKVHDDNNECKIGDLIEIVRSRPLSKTKCMVLKRVIEKQLQQG
jgi:small subunit ribosomal protein S17